MKGKTMHMLMFSYIVLALNLMALAVNVGAGNVLQTLLGLMVTAVIGYYIWREHK